MSARSRRDRSKQKSNRTPRSLGSEQLEARMLCTVNGLFNNLQTLLGSGSGVVLKSVVQSNAAPIVANAITVGASGAITGKTTTVSALGSDDRGESGLSYNWSVVSAPSGGGASFSENGRNASKNASVTFTKAGVYTISLRIVDAGGLSVTTSKQITVAQVLTSISLVSGDNVAIKAGSTLVAKGSVQTVRALGYDQFGALINGASFTWSTTANQADAPTISANGGSATIKFNKAGTFAFTARGGDGPAATFSISVAAQPSSISISPVGGLEVRGTTAQFNVDQIQDQFHNLLAVDTRLNWTVVSSPNGVNAPTFSSSGGLTTVTFKGAGAYVIKASLTDAQGHVISQSFSVNVVQNPTKLAAALSPVTVTGNSVLLTPGAMLDQFGKAMTSAAGVTWTAASVPGGATNPAILSSGRGTTATFFAAGSYTFQARMANGVTYLLSMTVKQTVTGITVSPGSTSVATGATKQFAAQLLDQFGTAMSGQSTYTWTANHGTISSSGLFTAPNAAGDATITVRSGTLTGTAHINFSAPAPAPAPSGGIQNTALAALVQSLDADGSLSRADVMQILRSVGNDGAVDAGELTDLRWLVSHAAQYSMAGYVQVLAGDVVNSNPANAQFQGQTLGNLAAGSSAAQLNNLVGKWFLGADHPTLTGNGVTYQAAAGSLFNGNPTHMDEFQGQLGDCYFISALGTIADRDANAIRNMFVDNGDGSFTVRFFAAAGVADYVTVDRSVAAYANGQFAYSNYGKSISNASNTLWIVLAEKAYAEWNATGKEGRNGQNSFAAIEGGWMGAVDYQVLGHSSADYGVTADSKSTMVAALAAGKAVTIGTNGNGGFGLYGSHAYAVLAYNASTDTFTLFNPWGFSQPGQLSWNQLQSSCSAFVVADVSGTTPTSSGLARAALSAGDRAALWAAIGEGNMAPAALATPLVANQPPTAGSGSSSSATRAAYAPEVRVLNALAEQMAEQTRGIQTAKADANPSQTAYGVDVLLTASDFVVPLGEGIA